MKLVIEVDGNFIQKMKKSYNTPKLSVHGAIEALTEQTKTIGSVANPETIIEVGEEYKEVFEEAGGTEWHFVESLNDRDIWIKFLKKATKA